jgi:tetratricopeptide (TPR) repeat protein
MRVVTLMLVLSSVAAAEGEPDEAVERARTHLKAGVAYYDEGKYEDAAKEMEAAYALKPLADLQYNLAQCYERLNKLTEAADAYKKYLTGVPAAEDRAPVEARIKNLEERAKALEAGAPAPAPPPPTEKVVFKTIVVYKEAPPKPGRGTRIAAAGCAVLALGALATGITFSVLAVQDARTVTRGGSLAVATPFDGAPAQAQSAGQTDVAVAWVGYGVAFVAALGAIGLYALGAKIDREAPKLTMAPSVSPTGGGLAVAGAF